jgi:hypothetical protein
MTLNLIIRFISRKISFTNQLIIACTPETKSLLPSLYKREEFPSFAKRGWGRFSEDYVFATMNFLPNPPSPPSVSSRTDFAKGGWTKVKWGEGLKTNRASPLPEHS